MHELSVTQRILEIALDHAKKHRARRVTQLRIVLGELSSFIDDSIQFYWDLISRGTICQGARLDFQRFPAEITCQDCGNAYELQGELTACPRCRSANVRITGGLDFRLDSIVIDADDGGAGAGGENAEKSPSGEDER